MNELPGWGALFRRAWAALRMRFTPLAPSCLDCGMPLDRTEQLVLVDAGRSKLPVKVWGDGGGRCSECANLRAEALRLEAGCQQREHNERVAADARARALFSKYNAALARGEVSSCAATRSYVWPGGSIPVEVASRIASQILASRQLEQWHDAGDPAYSGRAKIIASPLEWSDLLLRNRLLTSEPGPIMRPLSRRVPIE